MAPSTVAVTWVVLLAVAAMLSATLASDAVNLLNPSEVFGALLARRRTNPMQHMSLEDEVIDTLSNTSPCSVPADPNPQYYYLDFSECRQGNCPECKPLRNLPTIPYKNRPQVQPRPPSVPDMSRPQVQPRPPSVPDMSRPQVQPRPPSVPDMSRPQVQPRPPSVPDYSRPQVQPRPPSTVDISRPQIDPMPPQIQDLPRPQVVESTRNIPAPISGTSWIFPPSPGYPSHITYPPNPGCQTQPIITHPPSCPRENFIQTIVAPYQCPNVALPGGVSEDQILKVIYDGGYCQSSQCSVSVSELLLRLTLLEDRLRALVKCETRLRVYTNMLAQIQDKIRGSVQGNVGPPGDEGFMGQRGARGNRGPPGKCISHGGPPDGIPGPPGPPGPKGVAGPAGEKLCNCDGMPGPPGFVGYAFTGNPGPKGVKGQAGIRGQNFNPMNI